MLYRPFHYTTSFNTDLIVLIFSFNDDSIELTNLFYFYIGYEENNKIHNLYCSRAIWFSFVS